MINPNFLLKGQEVNHLDYGRCRVHDILYDPDNGELIGVGLVLLGGKNIILALNQDTGKFDALESPVRVERNPRLIDYVAPYVIATDPKGEVYIRCEECGNDSYSAYDVRELYCGSCHKFHEP